MGFGNIEGQGVAVESGVPNQPWGHIQTRQGAYNRVLAAQKLQPHAHMWVGIEGGVDWQINAQGLKQLVCFAWATVLDKNGVYGEACTASLVLPPAVAALVHGGMELGLANDQVFAQLNSKQQGGAVGILTQGVIDRTTYYTHALTLALVPLKQKTLYANA
jgi:inosine/xanthosine triphosphatase